MKTIITVQHAQSIQHINGMIGSWTDWDLTDLGIRQAESIGRNLLPFVEGRGFVMYSSDLKRAKQTAERLAGNLRIEPVYTQALRERNLGEAVGKSREWARENALMCEKSVDDRAFHGAESRRDVWNRLLPFLCGILSGETENTLLVSHGDTLSIFCALWLGLQPEDLNRMNLVGSAGGVSFLREDADGKRIISRLSDHSFMADAMRPGRASGAMQGA